MGAARERDSTDRSGEKQTHGLTVDEDYDADMAATDRRETESGIEIEPVYTAADAPAEREPPGVPAGTER